VALSAAPALAADPFNVSIRVEAKSRTLVKERTVTLADAPVIKDGNPEHSCNGQRAIGALQQGTGGNWDGQWFEGLGYSASEIMGHTPKSPGYFELWINNRLSSLGLCDAELDAGDDVLMFVQDCEFDPDLGACANPVTPLGVRVAKTIPKGEVRTVKVVDYDAQGKATAERGATVYVNGKVLGKTNREGKIKVRGSKLGVATVYAKKQNKARSETDRVRVVA
jgi:hypothetical protein